MAFISWRVHLVRRRYRSRPDHPSPQLSCAVSRDAAGKLLEGLPDRHRKARLQLRKRHQDDFAAWLFELEAGFSLCFYGFGSKWSLLKVSDPVEDCLPAAQLASDQCYAAAHPAEAYSGSIYSCCMILDCIAVCTINAAGVCRRLPEPRRGARSIRASASGDGAPSAGARRCRASP